MGFGFGLFIFIGIVLFFFFGVFFVSVIFDVLKGVCDLVFIWINLLGLIDFVYFIYCFSNLCCFLVVYCMFFDFKFRVSDGYMIVL